MILEIIHKKEKMFLSLAIKDNSEIGLLANKEGIKIFCNANECNINIKENFDVLVNVLCRVRENIFESLEEEKASLVIDLERVIKNVVQEMKD